MTKQDTQALYSLEASVLGAIFLDGSTLALFPRLEVADFTLGKHRAVFTAMRNLEAANRPIDVVTVQAELARTDNAAVTFADLGELTLHVPTVENALEYVARIRNASLARRIRLAASELLQADDPNDGAELLTQAWAALSRLAEDQEDATTSIADVVLQRFKQLEQIAAERLAGGRTLTGYPTGVSKLDELLGGWQPGIVSIVAARPAMGKSSLGLATSRACSAAKVGVHVFSLEDTRSAYADRTLAGESDVSSERIRTTALNRGDLGAITRAVGGLRGRKWLVDDRSGVTADEIVRSVRRHRRENETRVVIVDYVQLVAKPRGSKLSRHEELTDIVTTLANAAKHDGIAYVVMSQLNRQVEQRADKRPELADLRESGSLEERAKCVIGMYRGSVYGDPVRGVDWDPSWGPGHDYEPDRAEFEHAAQLKILKNSNGRTGTVFARWDGPTTRIS